MSIPDLDKLKRDADGMFDFLGEEAANHAQRPRKSNSDPDSFDMPIIRKPVPVSESGALRAGSASALPDFNDDFDFLTSEAPAESQEQKYPQTTNPVDQEDWFEGVHQFDDEKERSLQLPMLILLSTTLFIVAGAAAYWFSQNEFADLFKTKTAEVVQQNTNRSSQNEPVQTASSAVPTSAPSSAATPEALDVANSVSTASTNDVTAANTSPEQTEIAERATSSELISDTPLPSSLYTRFSTQLETLEALLADGQLDQAEASLKSMDRSVYGYGQAEFDDIQQQIVRMRGGVDAVEQAEVALAKQLEIEGLAAQAKAAEEARQAEQARLAEEARLAAEAKAAEEARQAEQARLAEAARLAAQAKQAELAQLAEQAKRADASRLAAQAEQAESVPQADNSELVSTPQSNEQLLLEQRAAAILAQREKAAEAQRRAAAAKARLEAQEQERANEAKAAAQARAARERATNARLEAQRLETQRAAEAAAAQAAREARATQLARAEALAEENRLAAAADTDQARTGLNIQPRQQNVPISDADFNRVAERFVELKNAIENRDITTVIALTQQSGQRVQQMLQIFENTQAVEARVSNIRSSNADGIISGTLKIQKLVKSGGLKVDAPDNLSSIRLTSNRTSSGWSPIGW